jgi:hypothetical protein
VCGTRHCSRIRTTARRTLAEAGLARLVHGLARASAERRDLRGDGTEVDIGGQAGVEADVAAAGVGLRAGCAHEGQQPSQTEQEGGLRDKHVMCACLSVCRFLFYFEFKADRGRADGESLCTVG